MARWFRFYDEVLNDPKVQRLSPALFKQWVNILCVASQRNGDVPDAIRLAFLLRISEDRARNAIETLTKLGLLAPTKTGHTPHNWAKRQYKSDASNERVKRHRERQRNAECNVTETPSDTDTDTDTDTEQPVTKVTGATAPPADAPTLAFTTPADDLKKKVWGPCLAWLAKETGKPPNTLRSLVGKWCQTAGDGAVIEAITACQRERPLSPIDWISAAIQQRHPERGKVASAFAGIAAAGRPERGAA